MKNCQQDILLPSPVGEGAGVRLFYKIGKIGRPHGICGEVLFMFTDDVFDTTDADHLMLLIDGLLVPFFMEEYRFKSDETAIVKFEGIDTKEQAQRLTNCEVHFPRQAAEEASHYSLDQFVGYTVISVSNESNVPESSSVSNGSVVGRITSIDTSTENYLFEILTPANDDLLIPVVDEWVESIDHKGMTIAMRLPEGLV